MTPSTHRLHCLDPRPAAGEPSRWIVLKLSVGAGPEDVEAAIEAVSYHLFEGHPVDFYIPSSWDHRPILADCRKIEKIAHAERHRSRIPDLQAAAFRILKANLRGPPREQDTLPDLGRQQNPLRQWPAKPLPSPGDPHPFMPRRGIDFEGLATPFDIIGPRFGVNGFQNHEAKMSSFASGSAALTQSPNPQPNASRYGCDRSSHRRRVQHRIPHPDPPPDRQARLRHRSRTQTRSSRQDTRDLRSELRPMAGSEGLGRGRAGDRARDL